MRLLLPLIALLPAVATAHEAAIDTPGAVISPADAAKAEGFDILAAHVHAEAEGRVTFHMTLASPAGAVTPTSVGALAGAPVLSYVWPTSLDPSAVGFEGGTGILALAATSHPDFDDTPLYDENGDGDKANDGAGWHAHWIVLTPTEACGSDALAVRDIPEGQTPALPATWPGLPLFIDSPDATPVLDATEISITVALPAGTVVSGTSFDGVTAALRVNENVHAPLLCVTDIFDVASGDLSLPGKID